MIVFVEFYIKGKPLGHYWMDYENRQHKTCLFHRCKIAMAEGVTVFISPVSKEGDFPEY